MPFQEAEAVIQQREAKDRREQLPPECQQRIEELGGVCVQGERNKDGDTEEKGEEKFCAEGPKQLASTYTPNLGYAA